MEMEVNGIVVIDKPAGITSAKLVAIVKKMLQVKKVGHTGTLDPFATGVMICCINQATRLARLPGLRPTQSRHHEEPIRAGLAAIRELADRDRRPPQPGGDPSERADPGT